LSSTDENLTTSVLEYRKRIVENVELAQNFARESLQRAQKNMKDYYDRNAKDPQFEVGQKVSCLSTFSLWSVKHLKCLVQECIVALCPSAKLGLYVLAWVFRLKNVSG